MRWAVAAIVIAQCCGTSLWFSPTGASEEVGRWLHIGAADFGWLLAATQIGFILGTAIFVLGGAADRYPPARIFVLSSLAGAALNCAWSLGEPSYALAWAARCGVGLALAGVYPIGMKMIVQRTRLHPGVSLGWLVAMLTLGTAMPQVLRAAGASLPWQAVIWGSSALALIGAALVMLLPHVGAEDARPQASMGSDGARGDVVHPVRLLLACRTFRASCAGYLGHMWELYAFWSVVPMLAVALCRPGDLVAAAALSAGVIAVGAFGCVLGGFLTRRLGSANVAAWSLAASGTVCLVYPLLPDDGPGAKTALLVLWGFFVIADSPQFSATSARSVPRRIVGIALAAQNSLGFLVTAVSIVVLQAALATWGESALWVLLPGPVLGLIAMRRIGRGRRPAPVHAHVR